MEGINKAIFIKISGSNEDDALLDTLGTDHHG